MKRCQVTFYNCHSKVEENLGSEDHLSMITYINCSAVTVLAGTSSSDGTILQYNGQNNFSNLLQSKIKILISNI